MSGGEDIRSKLRLVRNPEDPQSSISTGQDAAGYVAEQFRGIFDLHGKVALVIGAGGGLGSVISCALADFGASIVAADLNLAAATRTADLCHREGRPSMALEIDVTDPQSSIDVVDEIIASAGQLDILVNSAGINIRKPATEYAPDEWWQVVNTNLSGVFFSTQAAARHMVQRRYGRILSIGSVSSLLGHPYHAPYAAAKGGIAIMTKSFATEWAPLGITVNALGPAYTETGLTRAVLDDAERREKITATIPMGRLGTPQDLVGAAVFLCSDAASFVTGQTLYVDGGRTAD